MTKRNQVLTTIGALTVAAAVSLAAQAPAGGGQPPTGGGQGRAGGAPGGAPGRGAGGAPQAPDTLKVLIAGDNPSIAHHAKPGGSALGGTADNPALTYVNFWRVSWSPMGSGLACFVTINSPTPNAQKFVITDNPPMAEFIMTQVMTRLIPAFNQPPYAVERGSVAQTITGATEKIESCKSAAHNVELKWMGLGDPRWMDRVFGAINMTLASVPNKSAEVLLGGKRAPGEFSAGFIAVNETWRVEK